MTLLRNEVGTHCWLFYFTINMERVISLNIKKFIENDEVLKEMPFYIAYRVVVRLRELELLKEGNDG